MGILVIGIMYSMLGKQGVTSTGGVDPRTAIDRAWEARCLATKVTLTQAVQLYSIQNEPMKTLDIGRLIPGGPPTPQGCPCSYTLEISGKVTCKVHH